MAMRPSQINNGFMYETKKAHPGTGGPNDGLEIGSRARIEGTPLIVNAIYIATSLAIPIPSWILLFDVSAGQDPVGGEVADLPGPRITIAGAIVDFVPPTERIDLIDFVNRCKSPEADRDDLGIMYGQPFDNGLYIALSSTPIRYTPIAGNFINIAVRGRNLP
jgi:hypothetical protein